MQDLTYTVAGNYKDPANADLFICLPPPDPADDYMFTSVYNLSRDLPTGKHLNVILIIMQKQIDNSPLSASKTYVREKFDFTAATTHGNARRFNEDANESLVFVYHDNNPSREEIEAIYNDVDRHYDDVLNNGPHSLLDTPKRLGMSIVRK